MACFITFIEMTIIVNNIEDVHTIQTTGQLIPFIICIVLLIGAIKELVLELIRHVSFSLFMSHCNDRGLGRTDG